MLTDIKQENFTFVRETEDQGWLWLAGNLPSNTETLENEEADSLMSSIEVMCCSLPMNLVQDQHEEASYSTYNLKKHIMAP